MGREARLRAAGMEARSVIQPASPKGEGWEFLGDVAERIHSNWPLHCWRYAERGLNVMSAVEVAEVEVGAEDTGPCFHVSITRRDPAAPNGIGRCDSNDAAWVLAQFGLGGWEEDNHVPHGKARNFWRPVADRMVGIECPCKASEPVIREDKGDYEWRPA